MPPDEAVPTFKIAIKEGKISRLYVVMCYRCHRTVTTGNPELELFEADLMLAGWELMKDLWFCPECC